VTDLRYHILDVFTDRPLAGNPLAVFPDGQGIGDAEMQAIARELNLSETVFVLPPTLPGAARKVRIFTPAFEMPFAGHPTVGTGALLAVLGVVPREGSFVLEENVGPVPVTVRPAGALIHARLTVERPVEVRGGPSSDVAARILGLDPADMGARAPAGASAGFPFLVVTLREAAGLGRIRIDTALWQDTLGGAWARDLFVIAPAKEPGVDLRARMFAPELGVAEDPATGSACAALAGLLGMEATGDGVHRWVVLQGVEMGRPSRLELEADRAGGRVARVHVGGTSVLVGSGALNIAPPEAV
jgi:trans-2,3-dihydro-3-hydroxyanthranilate isomerase